MEHTFTIKVILSYEAPKLPAGKPQPFPLPNFKQVNVDPNMIKALLPHLNQVLGGLQLPQPQETPKEVPKEK